MVLESAESEDPRLIVVKLLGRPFTVVTGGLIKCS